MVPEFVGMMLEAIPLLLLLFCWTCFMIACGILIWNLEYQINCCIIAFVNF